MKLAIMQPYLFPYIGYFQLINAVDKFVVYDNIQFSKKGWINRNRILVNGKDEFFTVPIKKDSDFLNIDQRKLADTYQVEKNKLLRRIDASYKKAPYFEQVFPLLKKVFDNNEENLFTFIYRSILTVCTYLEIKTEIIISSTLQIDEGLRSQDKVLAICKATNASMYINPAGGMELYSREIFEQRNVELKFLTPEPVTYKQFDNEFVPWLSIIDVMMFNSKETTKKDLDLFKLI